MILADIRPGSRLQYDDGRPGHCVGATVLEVGCAGFVAQFDDRADTTAILIDDRAWTDHLTVIK